VSRTEQLAVDGAPSVEVRLRTGSLVVTEGPEGQVEVEIEGPDADAFRVVQRGSTILLEPERGSFGRWRSYDLTLRAPASTSLVARLATADLTAQAPLATVEVDTASGDVRVGDVAGALRVKTASGELKAGSVAGVLHFASASGDAEVAAVGGHARLHSASGDITIGSVGDSLAVKTASGDVRIDRYEGAACDCRSMSGDVSIGVPSGRTLEVDLETLSGAIRNDFAVGARGAGPSTGHARVQARSLSGDVVLTRA
jgi:hypothetical protein